FFQVFVSLFIFVLFFFLIFSNYLLLPSHIHLHLPFPILSSELRTLSLKLRALPAPLRHLPQATPFSSSDANSERVYPFPFSPSMSSTQPQRSGK
ncbi:hypothetical protein VIGAN_06204500, partial [Vigna angularis var. angularis]